MLAFAPEVLGYESGQDLVFSITFLFDNNRYYENVLDLVFYFF